MDDHSEEESHYRSKRYSKKRESSDSPLSISDDEEEDIGEPLEIRPPQAKIKHSHYRHPEKHSSSSRRTHRHKSHHSRRHQEERYFKERVEPEFKSSRSVHPKDYELERIKEYEAYKRKKYAHHIRREEKAAKAERYRAYQEELQKEQDLREKLERRKLHHELKEYHKKERKEREHRKRSKSDKDKDLYEHKEKRRKHHEEKSRKRESPEKVEPPTYKKSTIVFESEDSVKPGGKEMVVDIEMSPPVLKSEFDKYKVDSGEKERVVEEDVEEEEEGEVADNSGEGSSSESSSSSSSSNSDGSDSSASSSSSSTSNSSSGSSEVEVVPENESKPVAKEEETEEVEVGEEEEEEVEVAEEIKREIKEETPTPVVATNEDVDNDIELEKDTLPAYFPAIQGCRSVEEFQCLNHINEGTYGVVYRAKEKKTNKIVALKRLKMEKEKDGFPVTSLREINTLLKAQHPNIVTVKEIVVGSNMDKIFIVMDYVEHDLKSLMETMKKKKSSFTSSEVKCLMLQLLRAVNHLHDNWILHRDLKTSNLLLTHGGVLKVGDFGLAREYGSPLKPYTPIVVTLWYRAPELLLGAKRYSTFVDMWSVGCIFAEFLLMEPLFPGKAEIDQLTRIFKALGTPNETTWPEFFMLPVTQKVKFAKYPPNNIKSKFVPKNLTEMGYDLLIKFLTYNTKTRISADTALKHEYFNESPLPIDPSMFPTWPAKSEPGYRKAIMNSPKPPPGGQANKELDDDGFYIPADNKNPRGFSLQSTFNLKF